MSFLEVKNHLFLQYLIQVSFYLVLKSEGKSLKNHPIIDELVKTRALLERLRPLENKLKYQLDKLAKTDVKDDPLAFKPRPEALDAADEDEEGEAEEGVQERRKYRGQAGSDEEEEDGLYKPPKLMAMKYDEKAATKKERKEKKLLQKVRRTQRGLEQCVFLERGFVVVVRK